MKIQREVNGQIMEFELTSEELYSAHLEQEHKNDMQDIEDALENYRPDGAEDFYRTYEVPFDKVYGNDELISEIAHEKRHNMDKHDMHWDTARDEAISEILYRHREELCKEEAPAGRNEVYPGLPERCFSVLKSTGELVVIARGETGYYKVLSSSDREENQKLADGHNAEMGISKAQVAAMEAGSMFGWTAQAANPAVYDANGQFKRESLEDQIASAEQVQKAAQAAVVEMDYVALRNLLRSVEGAGMGHVEAYVVFTEDSFDRPYSEKSRTYVFSSDNKAFQSGMGGYSIYGACLDGTDQGIRLEAYMAAEKGGKAGWKIERCYMSQAELNKANKLVEAARDYKWVEEIR